MNISLTIVSFLANSADPNEILLSVAFHSGFHCQSTCLVVSSRLTVELFSL